MCLVVACICLPNGLEETENPAGPICWQDTTLGKRFYPTSRHIGCRSGCISSSVFMYALFAPCSSRQPRASFFNNGIRSTIWPSRIRRFFPGIKFSDLQLSLFATATSCSPPQRSTMSSEGPSERHQAIHLLGPWVVGACADLFLTGIVCCQVLNYFSWYKEDKPFIRYYVAGLGIISAAKSAHAFSIIWIQSILHINDLQGAILLNYISPWFAGNPMMVAVFDFYVQSYFCYRLYVVSKKWPVVLPIAIIFIFALFAMVLATYYITRGADASPQIAAWFAAHLSSVFAGDLFLTLTTAFFLVRSKKNVLPQTVGLISALVRLTFQTAAPAAICAMLNLIFSQIYVGTEDITSTAFNMMLPKIYALSVMWTLNARRTIRASHSSRGGISSSHDISGGRTAAGTRRTRREDVELGNFGNGIQVHTVQETVQHIDVRDMFNHSDETKTSHTTSGGNTNYVIPGPNDSYLDTDYKR
ncbi:hypothetical protein MKEN_00251100 [Mycena kentingensis (nom. inval.)]|nr:hypothetical protein MKEN_00251100 [Mycena kentingensis (nom. inval.)]